MSFLSNIFGRPKLDFHALCEKAMNDLKIKSQSHRDVWGLGSADRWDLNQETGTLSFTFPDKIVSCEAQIIGSWNGAKGSWLWAWQNPSILDPLKRASEKVRAYGMQHGIDTLTTPKWEGTEEDAWQMAALTCLLNESQGVYRGPAGDMFVFIAFGSPSIQKR